MLSAPLPLTVDPASPLRDVQLLAAARALGPGWADAERAQVSSVGGGITNLLFRLEDGDRPPLLIRVYGRNTELVIDRERENRLVARLSAAGVAPPVYGRFANGRVEGYLRGFRALEPAEMGLPTLRRKIAARLAELHSHPPEHPEPALWDTLERWMDSARSMHFQGEKARQHEALRLDLRADQLSRMRRAFEQDHAGRPSCRAVLAHNDLLAGNVLYQESTGEVRLIDFEYSGPSYAAFDLANHFCEHAGFDSDFARNFPSEEVRADFIDAWLGEDSNPTSRADVAEAVRFFVLPDHLFWGTWAVVQAKHSPIDFDYLGYAGLRMAGLDLHLRTLGVRI